MEVKTLKDFQNLKDSNGKYELKVSLDTYTLERLIAVANLNEFDMEDMLEEAIEDFINEYLD